MMIIFINIRNEGGNPVVSKCYTTADDAIESANHKITWEHGAYQPDYFTVAFPVNFDATKTFNRHTSYHENRD